MDLEKRVTDSILCTFQSFNAVVQIQKILSAHFTSKQMPPFGFAEQKGYTLYVYVLAVVMTSSRQQHSPSAFYSASNTGLPLGTAYRFMLVSNHRNVSTSFNIIHFDRTLINPITAGSDNIRFFSFSISTLNTSSWTCLRYNVTSTNKISKSSPPVCQKWMIFTHLKLWIASARHNFKWVKMRNK